MENDSAGGCFKSLLMSVGPRRGRWAKGKGTLQVHKSRWNLSRNKLFPSRAQLFLPDVLEIQKASSAERKLMGKPLVRDGVLMFSI